MGLQHVQYSGKEMVNKTKNYKIGNPPRHTDFVKRLYLVLPIHNNWLPILEHLWPQAVSTKRSTIHAIFWKADD